MYFMVYIVHMYSNIYVFRTENSPGLKDGQTRDTSDRKQQQRPEETTRPRYLRSQTKEGEKGKFSLILV